MSDKVMAVVVFDGKFWQGNILEYPHITAVDCNYVNECIVYLRTLLREEIPDAIIESQLIKGFRQ